MVDGKILIEKLLTYAEEFLHLEPLDKIYKRNILLREFKLDAPCDDAGDLSYIKTLTVPDVLVKEIEDYALENSLAVDGLLNLYSTYIFGLLSPLPSVVNKEFFAIRESQGIQKACDYLFNLSIKNNYIQKTAIDKNIMWEYKDGDNVLEITINLSKPEKDNKEIAKLLSMPKKATKYPACLLCKENEGYEGHASHPARENIRTISLNLDGEDWFVQYSPYAYYNEHCIIINKKHTPMEITRKTVKNLLDFVDVFPNYMAGSNAALPIVGGSILNHEHYQGGGHIMPMQKAKYKTMFASKQYPNVKAGIVDWYNSVIRLTSTDRVQICDLAGDIIEKWKTFSYEPSGVIAFSGDTPHNTLSPIIRKDGDDYVIDLILRNNRTDETYPDGIFHAHPEYHNIKKEGIGLIEAMGLFILPARLKKQLDMIADIICGNDTYNETELNNPDNYLYVHRDMIKSLVETIKTTSKEDALDAVKQRVNETCKNILFNTAVFKKDEVGVNGFTAFMNACGMEE
jgi:UDPglucose--hexose-1-phosphate uridylyltransferase